MKSILTAIEIVVPEPSQATVKRKSTSVTLLVFSIQTKILWVATPGNGIVFNRKVDVLVSAPIGTEYRFQWDNEPWTNWYRIGRFATIEIPKEISMNEKVKIDLLEKELKALEIEETREHDNTIERYRARRAEVKTRIEELKNPKKKTAKDFPSLKAAFDFLGEGYEPGLWRESGIIIPARISSLNTSHLKNILEYLDVAEELIKDKLRKIRTKHLEIAEELDRR